MIKLEFPTEDEVIHELHRTRIAGHTVFLKTIG